MNYLSYFVKSNTFLKKIDGVLSLMKFQFGIFASYLPDIAYRTQKEVSRAQSPYPKRSQSPTRREPERVREKVYQQPETYAQQPQRRSGFPGSQRFTISEKKYQICEIK